MLALLPFSLWSWSGGDRDKDMRWFLETPWSSPQPETSGIALRLHLPVSSSDPLDGEWGDAESTGWVASGKSGVRGQLVPDLDAAIPVTRDGFLLVNWTRRADLQLRSSWRNAEDNFQDSSEDARVNLSGLLNSSVSLSATWSSLFLGYRIRSGILEGTLGVERHSLRLSGSGSAEGAYNVQVSRAGLSGDTSEWEETSAQWNSAQFSSDWNGSYQGSGWGTRIALRAGPLYYRAHMAQDIRLRGSCSLNQTLPFFLDSLTLVATHDSASAWASGSTWDDILAVGTQTQNFSTEQAMRFHIPQSHTFGVFIGPFLALDYTWNSGAWRLEADGVSSSLDFRRFLVRGYTPNHVGQIHWSSRWLGLDAGAYWMDSGVHPILAGEFRWPKGPVPCSARLEALPWLRLSVEAVYAL